MMQERKRINMNRKRIRNHAGAWRNRMGVVALAALLATGCSSMTDSTAAHDPSDTPAVEAQPAGHGVEAAIETIPWSQVGPGWMLALWSPAISHRPGERRDPNEPDANKVTTTLYLVDPVGGRYPITTFQAGSTARLIDWSGDRSHALLYATKPGSVYDESVIAVDLRHGNQSTFDVVDGGPVRYARPDGTAMLISRGHYPAQPTLQRVDLSGKEELTYPLGPEYKGGALPTPDGTQLVVGTTEGLALVGNDGTRGKELPVPGNLTACTPVRWWTSPTVVLAHCTDTARFSHTGQLWQVPVDGTTPTALTAVNSGEGRDPGFSGDLGDTDAWQLPSGTFLQSIGGCGTVFLSRLTPDGHTTRVKVPGLSDSVVVNGVSGDKLVLVAKAGCGPGTSLLTYDPAANTFTALLGPTVNGGSVTQAIVYPGRK
jgi:TolB protein